jgi:hypothetical protein
MCFVRLRVESAEDPPDAEGLRISMFYERGWALISERYREEVTSRAKSIKKGGT